MAKNKPMGRAYLVPFVLVTSLFFMWGFARSILDVLNKHFQDSMHISMTESAMVQATTYIGYFLMAIPAGMFITRYGYRRGVVLGLLLFAVGSLCFIPGEVIGSFAAFLVALFIVGCGLVVLETSANPYITSLGDRETAASRLNLAQSFNGLGCILAPAIVAPLIFGENGDGSVALPYSVMGVIVLLIAGVFCRVKLPEITADDEAPSDKCQSTGQIVRSLLKNRTFMIGVAALFCYEIAEIAINSFFINYVTSDGWMDKTTAAVVLSFGGLGLFMMARVAGSVIMARIRAEKVLLVCAIATVAASLLVSLNLGVVSRGALFACYAFEAIMFPTIFAITVRSIPATSTKMASSILMMTPLGGAVGTLLMGFVADNTAISTAFIVPMLAYTVVLAFSAKSARAH